MCHIARQDRMPAARAIGLDLHRVRDPALTGAPYVILPDPQLRAADAEFTPLTQSIRRSRRSLPVRAGVSQTAPDAGVNRHAS